MQLETFDINNTPQIVERIKDMWSPDYGTAEFRLSYAEMVVRHNMTANDMQFQITEEGKLKAICFAEKKNEESSIDQWWNSQLKKLTPDEQKYFTSGRSYLHMMDLKTFSFMNNDDVKLSLFVSIEKGWGKVILNQAMEEFKRRGFKNMYLWTDCECDVDWYFENGYELVDKNIYEQYSRKDFEYLTYVFKKVL